LLDKCENDDSVRVIIITGTGTKCFSAGADITEFADIQKPAKCPNTTAINLFQNRKLSQSHHRRHAGYGATAAAANWPAAARSESWRKKRLSDFPK
jgi:enoyl-CoA hydratase/carnithine racemase